ncbi:MAG: hypothetical protein JWN44_1617 [Myxococcales bacterium]|nr:hypothetical protein [Myxococcales bacterium]
MMSSCDDTFTGDAAQPPEAMIVVTDGVSPTLVDVVAGAEVPLMRPPQGGQVTYAAVRVRNMNRCGVSIRGRFRDPMNNAELGFDGRTIDLVVGSDGWLRPDALQLSEFTNVALCPNYSTTRDNQGLTTNLELTATDKKGHTVTVTQPVVPTCASADATERALCVCECNKLPASMVRSCAADADMSM